MLEKGLKKEKSYLVEVDKTALAIGSGDMRVLATPALVAYLENAAMLAVATELEEGMTTVGGSVELKHLAPTFEGKPFTVLAEVVAVEGKKIDYKLLAIDNAGVIAEGTHTRFIVSRVKFSERAETR